MPTILLFGAGKSATYLIDYLADSCGDGSRKLLVADLDPALAAAKLKGRLHTEALGVNLEQEESRQQLIRQADVVISMLPAGLHPILAADCLKLGVHFFTASYESEALRAMRSEIEAKDLLFLNECGLDPGIDHMSALKIIHEAKAKGEVIRSFKSYCGGLLAPESEDNPWKYKFSWNPRNVVLAAQGGPAVFLEHGHLKLLPYHQVFARPIDFDIPNYGQLEAYPNRDSLKYIELYHLNGVKDMVRGTFRKPGYCKAWQVFVELGLCDDTQELHLPNSYTMSDWLGLYLPAGAGNLKSKLQAYTNCSDDSIEKIDYLGFFSQEQIPMITGTSAQILEEVLKSKWKLEANY